MRSSLSTTAERKKVGSSIGQSIDKVSVHPELPLASLVDLTALEADLNGSPAEL